MGTDDFHKKRKQSKIVRESKNKKVLPFILIVCEGEKTEPYYFNWYKENCKQDISIQIEGEGQNTISLVKRSIAIKKAKEKEENIKFDQVWCVFDRDSFTQQDYDNAFNYANSKNIEVAYSNECFEIWYLLHFHYFNTGMDRETAFKKLDELMKKNYHIRYTKNNPKMFEILKDKQSNAIQYATKHDENIKRWDKWNTNPSTTVYKLVQELNKYVKA